MEEIVQSLFEQGALLRNGTVKLAKSLSAIQIPSTVQAVLASRIDRLPPRAKGSAEHARGDWQGIPRRLVREDRREVGRRARQRTLADLQTAEFIYEQPPISDVAYVFKHALSQQVAARISVGRNTAKFCTNASRAYSRRNFRKRRRLSPSWLLITTRKVDWVQRRFPTGIAPVGERLRVGPTWRPSITSRRDSNCLGPARARAKKANADSTRSDSRCCLYLVRRKRRQAGSSRPAKRF